MKEEEQESSLSPDIQKPVQPWEVTATADAVEDWYEQGTDLPKVPLNLIRRFEMEPLLDNQNITEDDIPFDPNTEGEMYGRITGADWCVDTLIQSTEGWLNPVTYDFWRTPCDPETLECYLSPDEMRAYYEGFRDKFVDRYPHADFDLHDMYILTENLVHSRHALRSDPTLDTNITESNERYIIQLESVLGVIGQAVEGEMEEANGF